MSNFPVFSAVGESARGTLQRLLRIHESCRALRRPMEPHHRPRVDAARDTRIQGDRGGTSWHQPICHCRALRKLEDLEVIERDAIAAKGVPGYRLTHAGRSLAQSSWT
jgi:hypothetical protein